MDPLFVGLRDFLPGQALGTIQRLLADPVREPDVLRAEVDAYLGWVTSVADETGADATRAARIAAACHALLDGLTPSTPEAHRRLVQAACFYFVAQEDDLDGEGGFDDDAEVVSSIAAHLGRPDIVVE